MIKLYNIPTKSVDEVWKVVKNDIANALSRSNGYALSDHIKQWIKETKMQLWILWDSEAEKERVSTELKSEVADLSLEISQKVASSMTKKDQQKLIDKFIKDMG